MAKELGRRYGDKVVCTSLHPGNIRTEILRHAAGWKSSLVVRSFTFSGRYLLTLYSIGRCTLHRMAPLHSYTVRHHRLRRMPMGSFSSRGHGLVNRIRLLWILKLARSYGLGWRMRRRTCSYGCRNLIALAMYESHAFNTSPFSLLSRWECCLYPVRFHRV